MPLIQIKKIRFKGATYLNPVCIFIDKVDMVFGAWLFLNVICFFYKQSIYGRYIITRKNVTNQSIDTIVSLFETAHYFNKTIQDILWWMLFKLLEPHNTTTFLKDEKVRKSCARHRTCCPMSLPTPQVRVLRG